jgi:Lipopolysaccharide biosynthesis proteins, LPS:glycosyltransferases
MKYTIYMGYDPREALAYDVAQHSILSRTDPEEVEIIPLNLENVEVKEILTRPIERRDGKLWCPISQAPMATEFAISRFCVPFLQDHGWALFIDSDVICLGDIRELFALANPAYSVMCVKHEQKVKDGETKMDGQLQTFYARKNWSSCVLWNCDKHICGNSKLTLKALNTWLGRDLHAFKWLHDYEIGELPKKWNHLVGVGVGPDSDDLHGVLHFTLGGKWLPGWKGGTMDFFWEEERAAMESSCKSPEPVKSPA